MNWIDYFIISIIIISALTSLLHGVVYEAFSLVILTCSFFFAANYYNNLAVYFTFFTGQQTLRNSFAIAALFITTLIIGSIINRITQSIVKRIGLSNINHILGFLFGVMQGIFTVSAVLFFFDNYTGFPHSQDWQQSKLIPKFNNFNKWFFEYLKGISNLLPK